MRARDQTEGAGGENGQEDLAPIILTCSTWGKPGRVSTQASLSPQKCGTDTQRLGSGAEMLSPGSCCPERCAQLPTPAVLPQLQKGPRLAVCACAVPHCTPVLPFTSSSALFLHLSSQSRRSGQHCCSMVRTAHAQLLQSVTLLGGCVGGRKAPLPAGTAVDVRAQCCVRAAHHNAREVLKRGPAVMSC